MDSCAQEMEERHHEEESEEKVRDQKIEDLMDLQEKMSVDINKLLQEANRPPVYIYKRIKEANQIPEAKKEIFQLPGVTGAAYITNISSFLQKSGMSEQDFEKLKN